MTHQPFTYCPDCGKKGVQFHFAQAVPGEDGYGCRYCDFWFFTAGADPIDVTNHARWEMRNEMPITPPISPRRSPHRQVEGGCSCGWSGGGGWSEHLVREIGGHSDAP